MEMKHIYIVVIHSEYMCPHVSGEAYGTLEKAQDFCKHRADNPREESPFKFVGRQYTYMIDELALRTD